MKHDTREYREPGRPAHAGQPGKPRSGGEPPTPASAALAAVVAEVLLRHDAQHPPIDTAELYADLFIDSRRFLMIIRGLERALGIEIDDEDLMGVDLITYGDLVKFVNGVAEKASKNGNG